MDLLDEVPEHLLGHVEVGDHSVLEGPNRLDRARRAAQHALGLDPHRVHFAGARIDRDDARLGEDDAASAHVHERVGGAEVDRHVATAEAREIGEDAHRLLRRAVAASDRQMFCKEPIDRESGPACARSRVAASRGAGRKR